MVYGSNITQWVGMIGLMYPGDYAYATDLSLCTKTLGNTTDGYNTSSDCKNNDWLLEPDTGGTAQWTINPIAEHKVSAWHINPAGYISSGFTWYNQVVRPVVYLKSNVIVTGGDGSSSNPYTLGVG